MFKVSTLEFPKKNKAKLFHIRRKSDNLYLSTRYRRLDWVATDVKANCLSTDNDVARLVTKYGINLNEVYFDTNIESGWA